MFKAPLSISYNTIMQVLFDISQLRYSARVLSKSFSLPLGSSYIRNAVRARACEVDVDLIRCHLRTRHARKINVFGAFLLSEGHSPTDPYNKPFRLGLWNGGVVGGLFFRSALHPSLPSHLVGMCVQIQRMVA